MDIINLAIAFVLIPIGLPMIQRSERNGVTSCCSKPDIELAVDCDAVARSIQWRWQSALESNFGFCVKYECNSNDYCHDNSAAYDDDDIGQECYREYEKVQTHSKTMEDPDLAEGGICWFWVENRGEFDKYDFDGGGCSEVVFCKLNIPAKVLPSVTTGASYNTESHSIDDSAAFYVDTAYITSTTAISSASFVKNKTIPTMNQTVMQYSSSELVSAVSTQTPPASTFTFSTLSTSHTVSLSTPTQNTPTTHPIPLITVSSSAVSSGDSSHNKLSLYLLVVFSSIIFIAALMSAIGLFLYWNNLKQKKSMKILLDKMYFEEAEYVAKESDSEIESVLSVGGDVASITEDYLYMYNKILHSKHQQTKALQQAPLDLNELSLSSDSENDGDRETTDNENDKDSLYFSNYHSNSVGQAGHYSEPTTSSSQCASCISSTLN